MYQQPPRPRFAFWHAACVAVFLFSFLLSSSVMADEASTALTCRMSVPAKVIAGQRVPLVFEIHNQGAKALHVLTWNTPLEGMIGRPLDVTGPKGEVEYRGMMVKRGAPVAENYLHLKPHAKSRKTVDLAKGYDLSAPGKYKVSFTRNLHDVTTAKVPRAMEQHVATLLSCKSVSFEVISGG
jgi:peptidyl-Lys metalloendopeptidase